MIGAMEMKYTVKAYLCTNFSGLMDDFETDYWSEVEDFILENTQRGYNCEIIDNYNEETKFTYAEDFDEEALNPEDLIRDNKKTKVNMFYQDLLMEQQEQM